MIVDQITVRGENFIGLLGFATDAYAIVSPGFKMKKVLDVPTLTTKICGTNLVGMFCAGNSKGVLVPAYISDTELENIKRFCDDLGVEVGVIDSKYTALGNLICSNDKSAIIGESMREFNHIEKTLDVKTHSITIAGHDELGAYVFATNKGFIAHPKAEKELDLLSEILEVKGLAGTVNCGVPFVKSGLIANSNGYLTGAATTGIELQRIDDGLGFDY